VCPLCKRKLKPRITLTWDGDAKIVSVPPHKPKHWWKKKLSNAQKVNKHLRTKKNVVGRKKRYNHGKGKGLATILQRKQKK
jgi:hypothetical protein